MSLNANKPLPKKDTNRVPQPNLKVKGHAARVVQVIDLGLQARKAWKGEAKAPIDMISITYELSHEFMLDADGKVLADKPRWISETMPFYSLKADRATSTQRYRAIDPSEKFKGDFSQLLGEPCTVLVVHNPGSGVNAGKVFDNVGDVTPAMDVPGYVQPALVNTPIFFDLSAPDLEVFNGLPEFLQTKIKSNLNYQGSPLQKLLGEASPVPVQAAEDLAEEPQTVNEEADDDNNPY